MNQAAEPEFPQEGSVNIVVVVLNMTAIEAAQPAMLGQCFVPGKLDGAACFGQVIVQVQFALVVQ